MRDLPDTPRVVTVFVPVLWAALLLSGAVDLVLAYRAAQFGDDDVFDRLAYLGLEVGFLIAVGLLGIALLRGTSWSRWALAGLLAVAAVWRLVVADLAATGFTSRVLLAALWGLAAWSLATFPGMRPELRRRRRRRYQRLLGALDGPEDADRWLQVAAAWQDAGILLQADRRHIETTLTSWLDRQDPDAVPRIADLRRRLGALAPATRAGPAISTDG